jgi:hypothetical protein
MHGSLKNEKKNFRDFIFGLLLFVKKIGSIRFSQNELNKMHSSHEDIELCSVDRFGTIEPISIQLIDRYIII